MLRPCTRVVLLHAEWAGLREVGSAREAWALYKAGDSMPYFLAMGEPVVDIGRMVDWSSNAVDEYGVSVLSALDFPAGARPDFDALVAKLGVKADTSFLEEREIIREGLAQLSLEASYNQNVASKGRAHSNLLPVDPASLSPDANPVDRKELPLHVRASDRLSSVSKIGRALSVVQQVHARRHSEWRCLFCNAKAILETRLKTGFTWADLRNGKFKFDDRTFAVIRTFGPDMLFCGCQGGRVIAQTPFGITVLLCPTLSCPEWIDTSSYQMCKGCSRCGIRCSAPVPNVLSEEYSKITPIVSIKKQVDALRFSYIRVRKGHGKGKSAPEGEGARRITSLAACRIALNALRSDPDDFATGITFRVTERSLMWLPTWKWDRTGVNGM